MSTIQQLLDPETYARLAAMSAQPEVLAEAQVSMPADEPAVVQRTERDPAPVPTHRPRVARHRARVADDVEHPVTRVDIDTLTDAELGALIRRSAKAADVDDLRRRRREALALQAAEQARRDEQHRAEQVARDQGQLLDAFTLRGITVPVLDMREYGLDEVVPDAVLRPYNAVRASLGLDPLAEDVTYRVLVRSHTALTAASVIFARQG